MLIKLQNKNSNIQQLRILKGIATILDGLVTVFTLGAYKTTYIENIDRQIILAEYNSN